MFCSLSSSAGKEILDRLYPYSPFVLSVWLQSLDQEAHIIYILSLICLSFLSPWKRIFLEAWILVQAISQQATCKAYLSHHSWKLEILKPANPLLLSTQFQNPFPDIQIGSVQVSGNRRALFKSRNGSESSQMGVSFVNSDCHSEI